jgi:prepilin-type N-terminal cleavage/methylation domain-containing protein
MTRAMRKDLDDDEGFSLIELIVSMGILAILMAVVMTAIVTMYRDVRKQTGQTDVLDASRKVLSQLDKQVRYANAVRDPGAGTSGATFVEWRTGNTFQQQTCTQWRFDPTAKTLAYRSWQPPLTGTSPSAASTLTGWRQMADGIGLPAVGSIFSTNTVLPAAASPAAVPSHQVLTVAFTTTDGKPNTINRSQVTFTALNTPDGTAVSPTVCAEVSRP